VTWQASEALPADFYAEYALSLGAQGRWGALDTLLGELETQGLRFDPAVSRALMTAYGRGQELWRMEREAQMLRQVAYLASEGRNWFLDEVRSLHFGTDPILFLQRSAEKCREVQRSAEKCREVQRSAEKCSTPPGGVPRVRRAELVP